MDIAQSITINKGSHVRDIIQIGTVEQLSILILQGVDKLPTRYDGNIRSFLEYYLGSGVQPAAFGGRQATLDQLDHWLVDSESPRYAIVLARAGLGKSALLVQWINRLQAKAAESIHHVVFVPISLRWGTNLEFVVISALVARLAAILGQPPPIPNDLQVLRGLWLDYLRRDPPEGSQILVVLDGLDEAAGWQVGADLFPAIPPKHLRVLVSARPIAGDTEKSGWVQRLSWEQHAIVFQLANLSKEGLRECLSMLQAARSERIIQPEVLDHLWQITLGDPLLVRLYAEELATSTLVGDELDLSELTAAGTGLKGYFDKWHQDQLRIWGDAKPLRDRTVRSLLNLCALAMGPLSRADICALAPEAFPEAFAVNQAAEDVRRFIVGDGRETGYVFSHPRLAEYFSELLLEHQEVQSWRSRFVRYGLESVADLAAGCTPPEEFSRYVLQYHPAHLSDAGGSAADWAMLTSDHWYRAWASFDPSNAGFLESIDRVRQHTRSDFALTVNVKANLVFASLASQTNQLDSEALVVFAEAGVLTTPVAVSLARRHESIVDRAHALCGLASLVAEVDKPVLLQEARAAADELSGSSRAYVLLAIAGKSPDSSRQAIIDLAIECACQEDDLYRRFRILAAIAGTAPSDSVRQSINQSFETIPDSWHEVMQSKAIAICLPFLDSEKLSSASAMVERMAHSGQKATALAALASRMHGGDRDQTLSRALALASEVDLDSTVPRDTSLWRHSDELAQVAVQFDQPKRDETLRIAWRIAWDSSEVHAINDVVRTAGDMLPLDLVDDLRSRISELPKDFSRGDLFAYLASRSDQLEQVPLLEQARMDYRAGTSDSRTLGSSLLRLGSDPKIERELRKSILSEALIAFSRLDDRASVTRAMNALAASSSDDRLLEHILNRLQPDLSPTHWIDLAERLGHNRATYVIQEAWSRANNYQWTDVQEWSRLIKILPANLRRSAFQAALTKLRQLDDVFLYKGLSTLGGVVKLLNEESVPGPPISTVNCADMQFESLLPSSEPSSVEVPESEFTRLFMGTGGDPNSDHIADAQAPIDFAFELVKIANEPDDPYTHAVCQAHLADNIEDSWRSVLQERAREDVASISDIQLKAEALITISDHLQERDRVPVLNQALGLVSRISNSHERTELEDRIRERLPRLTSDEVRQLSKWLSDHAVGDFYRIASMASGAPCAKELLGLARSVNQANRRPLIQAAIEIARTSRPVRWAIASWATYVDALNLLAPYFSEEDVPALLRTIWKFPLASIALKNIAERWQDIFPEPDESLVWVTGSLSQFAKSRHDLLNAITELAPVLASIVGNSGIASIATAIEDAEKRWP